MYMWCIRFMLMHFHLSLLPSTFLLLLLMMMMMMMTMTTMTMIFLTFLICFCLFTMSCGYFVNFLCHKFFYVLL
jgi:hypothetical protein